MVFRRPSKWKTIVGDRKQVRQMLQHLGMVAERAEEGMAAVDRDGVLHFVNTAWARMHGYKTSNELLGKQIRAFHTAKQMKTEVIPFIERTKRRGRFTGQLEHVRRDGTTFPTQTKMIILKDEVGKADGVMVFVTDISERRRLGEKVTEANKQAETLKGQIAQLQHQVNEHKQAEEELKGHIDQLTRRVEELAAELTATNGKLQNEIAQREQAEGELEECRSQLEQRVEQQTSQFEAVNEKLQDEMNKCKQLQGELAAANEQLQNQVNAHKQMEESIRERIVKSTTAGGRLQHQEGEGEELEEALEEGPEEKDESRGEIRLFDGEKLRALAEWAKRLS